MSIRTLKTKRAFHQLRRIHQLHKAFSFSAVWYFKIVSNFHSLSHSTPKEAKKVSQVLKVRIKSYWGAAQGIPKRRGKAKITSQQMTRLTYY